MTELSVFEILEKRQIIDGPSAHFIISRSTIDRAIDILAECFFATNRKENSEPQGTLFNFSPTPAMAGGVYPCAEAKCRLEAAYQLALFGTLYGDKLILPNFFDYYYHMMQSGDFPTRSAYQQRQFKQRLANDIAVIFQYRPLIEAGIAEVNRTIRVVCRDCNKKHLASSKSYQDKIADLYKKIRPQLKNKMKFTLTSQDYISVQDELGYLGAQTGIETTGTLHKHLNKNYRKLPYDFNSKEVDDFGLIDFLADEAINDILEHNYYQDLSGVTYLTDRKLDIELIEGAARQEKIVSPVRPTDFYHSLPFLQDILVEDLVELRSRHNDSFNAYRDALTKAIREGEAVPSEIIAQILQPALNEIQNIITNNMRFYKARAGRKIALNTAVATTGFVASTMFNLPAANIPGLASATFSTSSIISDLADARSVPKDAMNNQFYFLWEMQKRFDR